MDCYEADTKRNVDKMIRMVKEAAGHGAQVITFPELATTGYNPPVIGDRFYSISEPIPGPCTDRLAQAARENEVYIITGISEKSSVPGILYNSNICISPQGEIVCLYRKIHVWYLEKLYFKPSVTCEYNTFELPWTRAALMICYDTAFPEMARTLALMGANILFDPAAWCIQDADTWDLNTRARAQENHVFMVCVNRCGQEGDLVLNGRSRIIGPRGTILAEADRDETIIYADIDLDAALAERIKLPYMKDRRPEAYGLIGRTEHS